MSSSTSSTSYAGGIAGDNRGSISNCYYLVAGNLRTNRGTPLTLEEMRVQKSYAGFDFDAVWSISPNQNNGYPTLRGMPAPGEARSSICITKKRYGSATGTYHLTVTVHNHGDKPLTGTVFVSAYDGNHLVSNRMYSVSALAPDGSQTISAELTTNGKVEQLKAFCWNMTSLRPLSDTAVTEG